MFFSFYTFLPCPWVHFLVIENVYDKLSVWLYQLSQLDYCRLEASPVCLSQTYTSGGRPKITAVLLATLALVLNGSAIRLVWPHQCGIGERRNILYDMLDSYLHFLYSRNVVFTKFPPRSCTEDTVWVSKIYTASLHGIRWGCQSSEKDAAAPRWGATSLCLWNCVWTLDYTVGGRGEPMQQKTRPGSRRQFQSASDLRGENFCKGCEISFFDKGRFAYRPARQSDKTFDPILWRRERRRRGSVPRSPPPAETLSAFSAPL